MKQPHTDSFPSLVFLWEGGDAPEDLVSRNGWSPTDWVAMPQEPCEAWRRGAITDCSCPIFLRRAGAR